MWLFTTKGFYSVVEHRDDPDCLLVRCRVKADLEAIRDDHIPTLSIFEDKRADYRYRAVVPRREWLATMLELGDEIDYDNFKKSVAKKQGKDRSRIYERVWWTLLELQPTRWWGRLWPRRSQTPLFDYEDIDYDGDLTEFDGEITYGFDADGRLCEDFGGGAAPSRDE